MIIKCYVDIVTHEKKKGQGYMRILFLHPNFPGQFKNTAKHFAELGHDVVFLCQTHYNRAIRGVNRMCLKGPLGNESLNELSLRASDRAFKMGEQYLKAFQKLRADKWNPDLVISHSGWGCGAFARYVWPKTKIISYLEWWFDATSDIYKYDKENKYLGLNSRSGEKHWQRNASIAQELSNSDEIVSPTEWQKTQLPEIFREKCKVIYDGVDLVKYSVNKKSGSKFFLELGPYISYGTRGMEPMRGFPQFIQSIPLILNKRPELKVVIAGEDEINYGGMKPFKGGSWKKWAINFLKKSKCINNVVWTGRLSEDKYISWLRHSLCHVYLTHPYILSWSFIESTVCCKKVIASNVKPVQEFIKYCDFEKVDHRDPDLIATAVLRALSSHSTKVLARSQEIHKKLGVQACMEAWTDVAGLKVTTDD